MAFRNYYSFVAPDVKAKKREDGACKRYESVEDSRAYSLDGHEKANFIQSILESPPEDSSSEDPESALTSTKTFDVLSNEQLVNKIKSLHKEIREKDVELVRTQKLFKEASEKLKEMNKAEEDKHKSETALKSSEALLEQLKEDKKKSDEKIESMQKEIEESRSIFFERTQSWEETKKRSEMFDGVLNERNALQEQLCKMYGISNVLRKFKTRADEADIMEQEIHKLRRDLKKASIGAGDESSRTRVKSFCDQCRKNSEELEKYDSMLETEIQKNVSSEAEKNFLRERVRMMDVMQAELLCYKAKYEEIETKMIKLEQMLVVAELKSEKDQKLREKLDELEHQLMETERNAQDLTNIVERQNHDLIERNVYIEALERRTDSLNGSRKALEDVTIGKVQSIVQQLSFVPPPVTCKCGFENCQCAVVVRSSSGISRKYESSKSSESSVHIPSQKVVKTQTDSSNSDFAREVLMLQSNHDISVEQIRLLRQQNAELSELLLLSNNEIEQMKIVMNEVEKQRGSNHELEKELLQLKTTHARDSEVMEQGFSSDIAAKEVLIQTLEDKLRQAREATSLLEQKLAAYEEEIEALRPLCKLPEQCSELCEKLSQTEAAAKNRDEMLQELKECLKLQKQENCKLEKNVHELEIDLDKQREYSERLAAQLRQQADSSSNGKSETDEQKQNRECLQMCVNDLKKRYYQLKRSKMDVIQTYEEKVQLIQAENEEMRANFAATISSNACQCESSGIKDLLLKKAGICGLNSLNQDELTELHDRIRLAMMKVKRSQSQRNAFPSDYYTRMTDQICAKYNLPNAASIPQEEVPVQDDDRVSSKTLPLILQTRRPSSLKNSRPRSSDCIAKPGKRVSISRKSSQK